MSLSTQRLSTIGLVALGAGVLLWSQYSGYGGPAKAGATESVQLAGTPAPASAKIASDEGGYRIAIAGLLREYALAESIDATVVSDPFIDPSTWLVSVDELPQVAVDQQDNRPLAGGDLLLTAVLDSPHGAVARVNGHLMIVGKPVEVSGCGIVTLIEVGQDGRSALLHTEQGIIRIQLQQAFTPLGG